MTPNELMLAESQYQKAINAELLKHANLFKSKSSTEYLNLASQFLSCATDRTVEQGRQDAVMTAIACLVNAWRIKQIDINRRTAPPTFPCRGEDVGGLTIE